MTERQRRFIPLYVKLGNASEAARQAGYKEKNADCISNRLMKKPEIVARIKELMDKTFNIDKPTYEKMTLEAYNNETNRSVKARYFELYGEVRGYRGDRSINVTVASLQNNQLDTIRNKRIQDLKQVELPIVTQVDQVPQVVDTNKVIDNKDTV